MSAVNFSTANQTLRQLLGNGLAYRVPRFQRDYSWNEDQWDDLWQDLRATLAGDEPAHYMGYLVLQSRDSKNFMEEDVDVFAALNDPSDEFWTEPQRQSVKELKLFNVRKPWPLLVAAYRRFKEREFSTVLRGCVVVAFRNSVIGGVPSAEQERAYNGAALKISKGEAKSPADALRELSRIYVPDKSFEAAFAEKVLRTTNAQLSGD